MGQNSTHQIQLVARKPSDRNVVHLALTLQLSEDILLGSSTVMKTKHVPSRASLVGHDHFEIVANLMRSEQIQLYRLFLLPLHFLTDEDEAEDQQFGKGMRGDELPEELRFKQRRLARIREAKEALEREAREKAEREAKDRAEGGKKKGKGAGKCEPSEVKPKPKAQRNFTDPYSRIMVDKASNSFQQAYSCQAAVDAEAQVIVAAEVTNEANDLRQLVPMAERIKANTGRKFPKALSADNGYFNGDHIQVLEKKTNLLIATEKEKHSEKKEQPSPRGRPAAGLTLKQRMARKLCTNTGKRLYGKRKEIVEPVFGQIKEARKFRQFLLRGLENVQQEWALVCTTHNLLKLYRSVWVPC